MVQPYNINIPNPGEQMLAGIQAGQDYMIKYKAQQEQARMQEDLAAFSQKEDKTPEDVQKLIFKYPVLSKQLDQSLQNLTEQQKENRISQLTPIYMALNKGNTDVAKAQVDELIAAYQNSGNEFEAKNLQTLKSNIELDPQGAITSSELLIYKAMGPEALQQYLTASQKAKTETEEGLKGRFQPSTEKGPDGTIWAMNDKGEVTVKDITGKVLEGEEARKAWLKSKEYGVDIANRTTYGKESGRLSAQKGTKAEIEEEVTRGKEQAKGEEGRVQSLIERGSLAAESTAGLRRGIQLLDQVKTGGPRAVGLRVKQLFGIETADEGELSNQLSKAVLSQLRETFGAAFTENEGRRLERIEASFTKSPATNKRLLQQSLQIAERTAKRAREAARKRGDIETVNDIDNLLKFSLSETGDMTQQTTELRTQPDLKSIPVAERLKMLQGP